MKVSHVLQTLFALETYAAAVAFARNIVHTATVIGTLIPTGVIICSVKVMISAKTIHVNLAHAVLKASTAKIGKTMRQIDLHSTHAKTVKVNAMGVWAAKALMAIINACSMTGIISATQTILTSLTLARAAKMKTVTLQHLALKLGKQCLTGVMANSVRKTLNALDRFAKRESSELAQLLIQVMLSMVLSSR